MPSASTFLKAKPTRRESVQIGNEGGWFSEIWASKRGFILDPPGKFTTCGF